MGYIDDHRQIGDSGSGRVNDQRCDMTGFLLQDVMSPCNGIERFIYPCFKHAKRHVGFTDFFQMI